jgi:hypothetical protein
MLIGECTHWLTASALLAGGGCGLCAGDAVSMPAHAAAAGAGLVIAAALAQRTWRQGRKSRAALADGRAREDDLTLLEAV